LGQKRGVTKIYNRGAGCPVWLSLYKEHDAKRVSVVIVSEVADGKGNKKYPR